MSDVSPSVVLSALANIGFPSDKSGAVPVKTGTSDRHPPECVIPDDVLIQFGPPDDERLLLETCRGMK
jgi:hypothetical protein